MRAGIAAVSRFLARPVAIFAVLAAVLGLPALASAHLERPSYWPDPAPEEVPGFDGLTAGGEVPEARSLASAVTGKGPGDVRVVCKGKRGATSMKLAKRSISKAVKSGYRVRPSQPKIKVSKKQGKRQLRINRKLAQKCRFSAIQAAIDKSGNFDRVVVMPGLYTEPKSRKAPVDDPKCNPSLLQEDASGNPTPSYEYQATCPHDQNLIYVQGREIKGDPQDAREDRQGIPEEELGECLRCNFQIEGSGITPTDTIMDAGKNYKNPTSPGAKPGSKNPEPQYCAEDEQYCYSKHVVLRADRADGFVGRNFLMRGGLEYGFYTEETDGTMLDRTKFFWNADYGHLSFTSDHSLVKNCDGFGAGDAVIYPGAAPETGEQATDFYPDAPRLNTTIRDCDMRGSGLGYSGSMGNAVRITHNNIYANATGIATDTLSSSGHPGYPADSSQIDNNYIYSNNFDVYATDDEGNGTAPVAPLVGVPIGTGILYAGENDAVVRDNHIFDNWRDGAMLFSVPDFFTSGGGAEGMIYSPESIPCPGYNGGESPSTGVSTSCANSFYDNSMGRVPNGFKKPSSVKMFGNKATPVSQKQQPNGNDFWWDEGGAPGLAPNNVENCWFNNTGPDGTEDSVTGSGMGDGVDPLPDCEDGENPAVSVGMGDTVKLLTLVSCSDGPSQESQCPWFEPNPKPGTEAAARDQRSELSDGKRRTKLPRNTGLINAYGDPAPNK